MEDRKNAVVLIAEDDETLIRFMRSKLSAEGFQPTVVDNGAELLHLASTLQPDVIVLDMLLPDTDGLTLCRQLKQNSKTTDIPVIFLTSQSGLSDRIASFDAGAQDYLAKPFQFPELYARLRALMRSREAANIARQRVGQKQEEFLAILNHELRAPLTVINIASEILAANNSLSAQRHDQLVGSIRSSALLLTSIIDDLLYLAHPTSHLKTVNVRNLIMTVVEECRQRTQEFGLHLMHRLSEMPTMQIDEVQMRRALLHLIDNAIKFTPRGGVITLAAFVDIAAIIHAKAVPSDHNIPGTIPEGLIPANNTSQWLVITVRDTGIGVASEHHQRIFEPFFQVDSSSTRTAPGLGIGLAVVAAFAQTHSGHFMVCSGGGQGTAIHIALPLSRRDYTAEPPVYEYDESAAGA